MRKYVTRSKSQLMTLSVFVFAAIIAGATSVYALTVISQGYLTKSPIPIGSIVSNSQDSSDYVSASTPKTADSTLGVIINNDDSLLSLTDSTKKQVQVATGGTVPVLVSDINGPIEQGQQITASPIAGVGMAANENVRTIGIAQGSMTGTRKENYKDASGQQKSVTLGQVPVAINVAYYFKQPDKTIVPAAIQNLANGIAGHKVETLPILISAAIFLITLIVVATMIYSMIRSSIISVGRNPMAQSAVYRDLVQMSALVLGILAVSFALIYLVLTKL